MMCAGHSYRYFWSTLAGPVCISYFILLSRCVASIHWPPSFRFPWLVVRFLPTLSLVHPPAKPHKEDSTIPKSQGHAQLLCLGCPSPNPQVWASAVSTAHQALGDSLRLHPEIRATGGETPPISARTDEEWNRHRHGQRKK